jgi:hypothetical protein
MEQDHLVRDREQEVDSVTVHRLQVHIMEGRFTALVVGGFHAEEDVGSPLAVDTDVDADVVFGEPIRSPRRITQLLNQHR